MGGLVKQLDLLHYVSTSFAILDYAWCISSSALPEHELAEYTWKSVIIRSRFYAKIMKACFYNEQK